MQAINILIVAVVINLFFAPHLWADDAVKAAVMVESLDVRSLEADVIAQKVRVRSLPGRLLEVNDNIKGTYGGSFMGANGINSYGGSFYGPDRWGRTRI